jgi:hypothetical protein
MPDSNATGGLNSGEKQRAIKIKKTTAAAILLVGYAGLMTENIWEANIVLLLR